MYEKAFEFDLGKTLISKLFLSRSTTIHTNFKTFDFTSLKNLYYCGQKVR